MLNKARKKKAVVLVIVVLVMAIVGTNAMRGEFIPTARDTAMPPQGALFTPARDYDFELMGQFGDIRYYFRADRDIILVRDVHGRFEWMTGLNAPFGMDLDGAIAAAQSDEELRRVAEPREAMLNATWTAFANSLLSIETINDHLNHGIISSSSQNGARSQLFEIAHGHFRLDVDFYIMDVQIPVHIFLCNSGITYRIFNEELAGSNLHQVAAIVLTPFLGAAGGGRYFFDFETMAYGQREYMPMVPGYAVIPDGSGALFRFNENHVSFNAYEGFVFGQNPSESTNPLSSSRGSRARPSPRMPVFGVSHGYNQQAFAAWATDGAQHMEIVFMPHGNTTLYNFVYPRFRRSGIIAQIYNRSGSAFTTTFPNPMEFDITMEYRFLHGEDANYVGIARAYRAHLIEEDVLTVGTVPQDGIVPVRLDFLMSDVRRSILGRTNVVTTTASQVEYIIGDMQNSGIASINGGLHGFQRGGVTTGEPWALNFTRSIGTARDFRRLFANMDDIGADISFAQNYKIINSFQANLARNQAQHVSRWGIHFMIADEGFQPVTFASYARPDRAVQWFEQQTTRAINMGMPSVTVSGITDILVSHHTWRDSYSPTDVMEMYQEAFANTTVPINAYNPNQYLWQYVDRFLQAPVFTSQYVLSTDTVPFLQLILNNTMELYAPYSNFNFYTRADMLRMIDFNVFPSFILTYQPAHLLGGTNSSHLFSTEYAIYRDIILDVYSQIQPILSRVKGLEWVNRQVLQNGVVLNTYECGLEVIINYTDEAFYHRGVHVYAQTARVFEGG